MKRITGSKIAIAAGLGIFAIATWFAARTPTPPPLPMTASTASSTLSNASGTTSTKGVRTSPGTPAKIKVRPIIIAITSPTSSALWTIGKQNTISWSKAAGVTGQMYLINATSGVIAGWIQQNIAPGQTYFPWNTSELSVGPTDPMGKDVLPGEYIIKISFASPSVPSVTSAPFFIVKPAQHASL